MLFRNNLFDPSYLKLIEFRIRIAVICLFTIPITTLVYYRIFTSTFTETPDEIAVKYLLNIPCLNVYIFQL